jgi:hypothetical protein
MSDAFPGAAYQLSLAPVLRAIRLTADGIGESFGRD